MKLKIPARQLSTISLMVALGAAVRVSVNWVAFTTPSLPYGILVKIGLCETLAFTSGFVFGPVQGFVTGALIIVVSDVLTWAGPWTPIIAAIIGLLGVCGGLLRRLTENPGVPFLGAMAVVLTLISETLQNLYTTWFYMVFGMPLGVALLTAFGGGIVSMVTAIINNLVLFTAVAPRIIAVIRRMVISNQREKLGAEKSEENP